MGTKTIGLREDIYERLKARKREDESFTELVDRLLEEATVDWQDGFGTLSEEDATDLEEIVATTRSETADGLAARQQDALKSLATIDSEDDHDPDSEADD